MKWTALLRLLLPAMLLLVPPFVRTMAQREFTIVSLNAENFFDCHDRADKEDGDFLPSSPRKWTPRRMNAKLRLLGRTLAVAGGERLPDLVGLCEVESDTVMRQLTGHGPLWSADYRYLITDCEDSRGINVALLYRSGTFRLLQSESIRPAFPSLPEIKTRDVLHACGRLLTGDTLDVLVMHAPSRLNPLNHGEDHRRALFKMVRERADSIMSRRESPQVVIMGDFNEDSDSQSVRETLARGAFAPGENHHRERELYNMMEGKKGKHKGVMGSYCYKGKWQTLDQIIVSGRLLNGNSPLHVTREGGRIVDAEHLLERVGKKWRPRRTYEGVTYLGGLSDHLPVALRLLYSW